MPAADPPSENQIAAWALALVQAASPNPPGDTNAAAAAATAILHEAIPRIEVTLHPGSATVQNLVARLHGAAPGRRLVFNGHLDTYPVGDPGPWTTNPAGQLVNRRLYGRGAADMKGGIAAAIAALATLARSPGWHGEAVLTLAGDEESMGSLGTKFLMDAVPHATGDAVIIPDAGSPRVLRFGEKGFLWLEIKATGRPAHGAHVHLGDNAIERLMLALTRLQSLRALPVHPPEAVTRAIAASKPISEPLAGPGEAHTLGQVTVNIGRLEGGTSTNLVPAHARAGVDIRLPVGIGTATVLETITRLLDLPGITHQVLRRFEPNHTDPGSELIRLAATAAEHVTRGPVATNMRVGGSDARWFRMASLPTLVYGPTPHNMGAPDEWVDLSELHQIAQVLTQTAQTYLVSPLPSREGPGEGNAR